MVIQDRVTARPHPAMSAMPESGSELSDGPPTAGVDDNQGDPTLAKEGAGRYDGGENHLPRGALFRTTRTAQQ
jgi:hypothetical protein